MSFLSTVTSVLSGDIFKSVKDLATTYFPPDMSEEKKAEFQQKAGELALKTQTQILEAAADAEASLNKRIAEQEGTASDLLQLPIVGRVILFLRGMQRPVWGFFTMYLDFNWFTLSPEYTEQQQSALIVINILVLGFLFGERTIKNLEPLLVKIFSKQ